jgi:hypothetical protein
MISERERVGQMTVKEYVLNRLNQGETDLRVLARQTRSQLPSLGISFSYITKIRNEWRKASALQEPRGKRFAPHQRCHQPAPIARRFAAEVNGPLG